MLWVDRVGDRRGALRPAWRTVFLWKTEDRQKKEKDGQSKSLANHARLAPQFSGNMQCSKEKAKEHNRDAHSGVQSSAGREGRGSVAAPSPRAPQPCSYCATATFCSTSTKGDISNKLRMGTFLKSLDT